MPDDRPLFDRLSDPVVLPLRASFDGGAAAEGRPVLRLYRGPQAFQLCLANQSDRILTLSPDRAVITLSFMKSTIASLAELELEDAQTDRWAIEKEVTRDGETRITLTPVDAASVIAPQDTLRIGFAGVLPDAGRGPRGTQVAVDYTGVFDDENKMLSDHLLVRLGLVDEDARQEGMRIEVLRSGSVGVDKRFCVVPDGKTNSLIASGIVQQTLDLHMTNISGGELIVNPGGDRLPAIHLEPGLAGPDPQPRLEDLGRNDCQVRNDGKTLSFVKPFTWSPSLVIPLRLKMHAAVPSGVYPVTLRYENLGPEQNMDGRVVLLITVQPVFYRGKDATLQGGLTVKSGKLDVKDFIAETAEITREFTAQKASLGSLDVSGDLDLGGNLKITGNGAELPKTNVRGALTFTDLLSGPSAHIANIDEVKTLTICQDPPHKDARQGKFKFRVLGGKLYIDGASFGAPICFERNKLLIQKVDVQMRLNAHDVDVAEQLRVKKNIEIGPVLERGKPKSLLPDKVAELAKLHGDLSKKYFEHRWSIRVQGGDLVFKHNGKEMGRFRGRPDEARIAEPPT